jgi:hypothetical protein
VRYRGYSGIGLVISHHLVEGKSRKLQYSLRGILVYKHLSIILDGFLHSSFEGLIYNSVSMCCNLCRFHSLGIGWKIYLSDKMDTSVPHYAGTNEHGQGKGGT